MTRCRCRNRHDPAKTLALAPELGSFGFETLVGTKCNNGHRFDHHAKTIPITIMASAIIIQF
jgi:hypothetical protein